ncbi:MAG: hypothetical protein J6K24_01775 [Tidjanibacter sp.]|nr:hypothetical protein [Tidjanibacter sp.]
MKKIFTILAVAAMSLAMVSCGGAKSPVDRYEAIVVDMEKAVENKDAEAVKAAYMEMEELQEALKAEGIEESSLSEEEQAELKQLGERLLVALMQAAAFTE